MTDTSTSNQRRGLILLADAIFLFAIFFITRTLELGWLDILMISLVVLSLLLLAFDQFTKPSGGTAAMINAAQTVIAIVVSLRFLVLFIGDMEALASLFLYGAIIIFFFVGVTGVLSLVTGRNASEPEGSPEPEPEVEAEVEAEEIAEPEPVEASTEAAEESTGDEEKPKEA